MYFLAPLVYAVALSWLFYGQKEILTQEHYDVAAKRAKDITAYEKQQREQKKVRRGVVEQFQAQSAYGSDITRLQAAGQYTLLRT